MTASTVGAAECLTHAFNALRDFDHLDPVGQDMLRRFIQRIEHLRDREMERRSAADRHPSLERLAVVNNVSCFASSMIIKYQGSRCLLRVRAVTPYP